MITLRVGEGEQGAEFTAHKNILCKASPFFKAACKPEWMKPGDNVIKLPEDNAEVIKMMIFWIYHDEVCIAKFDDKSVIDTCEKALKAPWGLFAQLYVIGQKYQMPRLQDDAIDALLHHCEDHYLTAGIISWVYENTLKGDKLRKLIFRIAKRDLDRSKLATFCNSLCWEFLFDMTYASAEDVDGQELEDNEILIAHDDPQEDFCAEYHVDGGCEGDCVEIKNYILPSDG
jgi:hypothetical protein